MSYIFENVAPLSHALDYHVERHNLIASNVANADTPGYRPREMTFDATLGELGGQLAMERTTEGHLGTASGGEPESFTVYEETWATPGSDGNYVRLEHEMSRMQANGVRYRATTQMVSHHLGMLRYAIAGRR
jgi:flagellar basal-body rod protein FlgB